MHLRSGSNAVDFNHEGSGRDESLTVLKAFALGEEELEKEISPHVVNCLNSVAEIARYNNLHVPIFGCICSPVELKMLFQPPSEALQILEKSVIVIFKAGL